MRRQLLPSRDLHGHLHGDPGHRVPSGRPRHRPARVQGQGRRLDHRAQRQGGGLVAHRPGVHHQEGRSPAPSTSSPARRPRSGASGNTVAGYDPTLSSGSNLGPTNPAFLKEVAQRVKDYRKLNRLSPNTKVPVDAVTASGSGLDPHISIANARLQAPRVADERGISVAKVNQLVDDHTTSRAFGILGEKAVNVLELNLALDQLTGEPRPGESVGFRHGTRDASHLPRGRARRGQDLRDARTRACGERAAAPTSWSASSRPTVAPTPQAQIGDLEVVPRHTVDLPRARSSRRWTSTPSSPASRRWRWSTSSRTPTCPGSRNEKRWQDVEELLDAGHRRDLDRERPAPRVDERRGRADHRHQAARDRSRTRWCGRRTRSSSST